MKAEEFLKQAMLAERRVNAASRKVELYKAMAEKVTSVLGGEQVSHTRDVTANENAVLRLVEAQDHLKQFQDEYNSIVDEIVDVLNCLRDHDIEEILSNYYLKHRSISAISEEMHVSRSFIYKHYRRGMLELESLLAKK